MTLLPSTSTLLLAGGAASADGDTDGEIPDGLPTESPDSILMTTQSGALALVVPLDEQSYRRLGALQTHLAGVLDHPCGLNPRAYRAVESEGFGGRGILDGQVLRRWSELSSQKKIEACKRIGEEVSDVRAWLEGLCGGVLGYL